MGKRIRACVPVMKTRPRTSVYFSSREIAPLLSVPFCGRGAFMESPNQKLCLWIRRLCCPQTHLLKRRGQPVFVQSMYIVDLSDALLNIYVNRYVSRSMAKKTTPKKACRN